jgi:FkbM family methyltransferase
MNIISILRFIVRHPLNRKNKTKAVWRFIKWQINIRLNPYPIIYPFTDKARLIVQKGMTGATGNLYCGLHEFNDMAFLLHTLREKDYFVDIGANVGSYTILASAHAGAHTISVEPLPSTFLHLVRNIAVNEIHEKVTAYNIALGSEKDSLEFTSLYDTENHIANEGDHNTIKVPVETLDELMIGKQIPVLLKIDVEGFETKVLQGSIETLQQNGLKAIIIELNGLGERYNFDENKIHNQLIELNFRPFQYDPMERKLLSIDTFGPFNTIYIRDLDFIRQRIKSAAKIRILDQEI